MNSKGVGINQIFIVIGILTIFSGVLIHGWIGIKIAGGSKFKKFFKESLFATLISITGYLIFFIALILLSQEFSFDIVIGILFFSVLLSFFEWVFLVGAAIINRKKLEFLRKITKK